MKSVVIDGTRYAPFSKVGEGEVVTIGEVVVKYGDGFPWLYLGFNMPQTKFNPGDKVRLVKEVKK